MWRKISQKVAYMRPWFKLIQQQKSQKNSNKILNKTQPQHKKQRQKSLTKFNSLQSSKKPREITPQEPESTRNKSRNGHRLTCKYLPSRASSAHSGHQRLNVPETFRPETPRHLIRKGRKRPSRFLLSTCVLRACSSWILRSVSVWRRSFLGKHCFGLWGGVFVGGYFWFSWRLLFGFVWNREMMKSGVCEFVCFWYGIEELESMDLLV
jgi:hypothetical protein